MTDDEVEQRLKAQRRQLEQQQKKDTESQNLLQNRQEVANRTFSSSFFDRVADSDLASELQHKIEEKLPATFSSAHITGQRRRSYEERQDLLNRAKAERFVVERKPGALLDRHPGIHAVARGEEVDVDRPPQAGPVADAGAEVPTDMDAEERRIARGAIREVATTQQSLAVGGTGLKQFTTATSETHTVKHDTDEDGWLSRATGVFK